MRYTRGVPEVGKKSRMCTFKKVESETVRIVALFMLLPVQSTQLQHK